mmetsp:Transcript_11942/g.25598  ORF Transcript_11942/g.25598 Transcript_11942/m.25598 type:complete len:81 (+) Transcript_11942:96-338(+)
MPSTAVFNRKKGKTLEQRRRQDTRDRKLNKKVAKGVVKKTETRRKGAVKLPAKSKKRERKDRVRQNNNKNASSSVDAMIS